MHELQLGNFLGNYLKNNTGDLINNLNVSKKCSEQISIFLNDFANYESWTLKMLDASSKIPEGILQGNLKDIGMYDECISINITKENMSIIGRHCMYTLSIIIPNPSITKTPTLSICSPDACNSNDVKNLLNSAFNVVKQYVNNSDLTIKSVTCSNINSQPWETGAIITIIALGSLICFLMICTICDCVIKVKKIDTSNNMFLNAICQFSFYANGKRILDTARRNGDLPTISGLRFFSMCWVILGHTYYNELSDLFINKADPLQWVRSWSAIYILVGHFAVDTFLVISGVLVSYFFLKNVNKNTKFSLLNFYFHRWLRLTPALGGLLLFAVYIFPKFGSGPMWEAPMIDQSNYCSKNWWRILLYIQNYGSSENLMCLGYTWYLAVDMQLFWISPLILIPLAKKPKIGFTILGVLIIASMILPAIIAVKNKFSWSLLFNLDETITADMMFYYYVPTYTRAGPYLLGILLGYLLVSKKYRPNKIILRIGWIFTVISISFSILSWRIFQMKNYKYNIYWEIFYTSLSQHIWALGMCWIIYISTHKYGGIINSFLSLPIFLPLSKISYCIYLLHFVIQTMKINATRTSQYFSSIFMINVFISNFVLSIVSGFIFSLIFESPILALEKLLTKKNPNDDEIKNETINNTMSIGITNHAYEIGSH